MLMQTFLQFIDVSKALFQQISKFQIKRFFLLAKFGKVLHKIDTIDDLLDRTYKATSLIISYPVRLLSACSNERSQFDLVVFTATFDI